MTKALTHEQFVSKAREKHGDKYEYPDQYKTRKEPINIKCPTHGLFLQTPGHHLNGQGCPACANLARSVNQRQPVEKFIERAKEVHGEDTYGYDQVEYVNNSVPVTIICKIHGAFQRTPGLHNDGHGCQKCPKSRIKIPRETKAKNTKSNLADFIEKAKKRHGDTYLYHSYKTSRDLAEIECKIHGKFEQSPSSHLSGHGCPDCAIVKISESKCLGLEEFLKRAKEVHSDLYEYHEFKYTGRNQRIDIYCTKCQQDFTQVIGDHLGGSGCTNCSKFKSEKLCRKILGKYTGEKFPKYRASWLGRMELDGYCQALNLAFEYQGRQHYEFMEFFHRTEDGLKKQQERDLKKRELCEEKGIRLIEIKYTYDFKDPKALENHIIDTLLQIPDEALNQRVRKILESEPVEEDLTAQLGQLGI